MTDKDQSAQQLWLFTPRVRATPPDGSELGAVFKAYRVENNMTQYELGDLLGLDQSYLSMIERGKRFIRDVGELRRIAHMLDIPEQELGLLPLTYADAHSVLPWTAGGGAAPHAVLDSQRAWRAARSVLNQNRVKLSDVASDLYPGIERVGDTALLARKEWLPPLPVELERVSLAWRSEPAAPHVTGAEVESEAVRPLSVRGRHARYSDAIRLVDRPSLFVNRPSYRLLDLIWNGNGGRLEMGYTSYFSMVDVCEAVGHELATAWSDAGAPPQLSELPLRSLIGDPFDLARRTVLPSIDTLTLRRAPDGSASFVLHQREAGNVAVAGGMLHVIPAGVFQPSSALPWDQANDFDPWRNILREFAEEFLGDPEADGESGEPIDYEGCEPYSSLNAARRAGTLKAWCLGVGLDPLTLVGEILTVVAIDAEVYDRVFAAMVPRNAEGALTGADPDRPESGIPFTEENVKRLLTSEPLAPAAAACLHLAWEHRDLILG